MKRVALLNPPQWDPRQPGLALPVLAGFLKMQGAEVKNWDLNLSLYRKLLFSSSPGSMNDLLVKRYLSPEILRDLEEFGNVTGLLQKVIYETYDPTGSFHLYWDALYGPLSPSRSRDWKHMAQTPSCLPLMEFLKEELLGIKIFDPAILGISAISDTQVLPAIALASYFRQALPGVKLFFGGDAFAYRRTLLSRVPWLFQIVDGICVGDGEPALREILNGSPKEAIPNFLFAADGVVRESETRETWNFSPEALPLASPDFSLIPVESYLCPELVVPVELARGCPWGACAFCIHPFGSSLEKPRYHGKPVEAVVREIDRLRRAGLNRFFLVDEAIGPEALMKLSQGLAWLPGAVQWICYSRLERGHTRDIFSQARQAGCRKIFFGLETGSPGLLKRFHKGVQVDAARRVCKDCAAAGIGIHLFLMTGFPGETKEDQAATIAFLKEVLPFVDPFSFTFDLFPLWSELETKIHRAPEQFGALGIREEPGCDLAYQYRLNLPETNRLTPQAYLEQIEVAVDSILGTKPGLRHGRWSQDSLHLLLIERAGETGGG